MSAGNAGYVDELLTLAREVDLFAAIERLSAEPDPEAAAKAFGELAKCFYREKSLGRVVAVARAGIQFFLGYAGDAEQRDVVRLLGKKLAYNLAADTWPGWDEPGIVITASELDAGLDAARVNLRLTLELGRGPQVESKAHWLLGAHWLARGELDSAGAAFSRAAECARLAEKVDEERMCAGYGALVGTLRGDAAARAELERIVQDLKADGASDEAKFFAEQLTTALAVFRGREPERQKSA